MFHATSFRRIVSCGSLLFLPLVWGSGAHGATGAINVCPSTFVKLLGSYNESSNWTSVQKNSQTGCFTENFSFANSTATTGNVTVNFLYGPDEHNLYYSGACAYTWVTQPNGTSQCAVSLSVVHSGSDLGSCSASQPANSGNCSFTASGNEQ
jgi:hypothetical protein